MSELNYDRFTVGEVAGRISWKQQDGKTGYTEKDDERKGRVVGELEWNHERQWMNDYGSFSFYLYPERSDTDPLAEIEIQRRFYHPCMAVQIRAGEKEGSRVMVVRYLKLEGEGRNFSHQYGERAIAMNFQTDEEMWDMLVEQFDSVLQSGVVDYLNVWLDQHKAKQIEQEAFVQRQKDRKAVRHELATKMSGRMVELWGGA